MPRTHINIGSNLGDRIANIRRAIAAIHALAERHSADPQWRESTPVVSRPWGYESAHEYVNVGVSFETDLSPVALLEALQGIERSISDAPHRRADGTYADRLIDIDIILYGNVRIDTPRLTLPHPRAWQRPFVLTPLLEIDPTLHHLLQPKD